MKLRANQGRLKIEHSIIDGLRPALERLLWHEEIRSIIPGVIRQVRDAKGPVKIRVTVATQNGWKGIALSAGSRQELFISTSLSKEALEGIVEYELGRL
ncbi:MAG: DUF2103 domain-containing protein [Bryobacteraceae bacterium]|nr:hypothetical protein [Solibacteraceae bacterium]MCL4842445.1 hypothetical protein [Bryobacteraceae bacterium]MCO5350856.1 DUF2103 domain-containing protein [Bryobacteraceae bacterium]